MTYEAFRRARAYGYNPGPGIAYGDGGNGGGSGAGFQAFSNAFFPTSINPEFNPKDPNAIDPYTGTNFISRWKAGKANKEFQKQKILADFANNQAFADYKKQVEFDSDQAVKNAQKEYEQKQKWSDEALGDTGTYFGQAAGNLPTDTLSRIIPQDQVFSSPQEQAKYVQAQFGPGTVDDYAFKASEAFQQGRAGEAASKKYIPFGEGRLDVTNNTIYNPSKILKTRVPRIVMVRTGKMNYDPTNPDGPGIPEMEERTVYDEEEQMVPAYATSLPQPGKITEELVRKTASKPPVHATPGGIQPDIRSLKDSIIPSVQTQPSPLPLNLNLRQAPDIRALKENLPAPAVKEPAKVEAKKPTFRELVRQGTSNLETNKTPDLEAVIKAYAPVAGRGAKNFGEFLLELLLGKHDPIIQATLPKEKR